MTLEVDEDNLKEGLLGLVVGLLEIIQKSIEREALRRIEEDDSLTEEEVERIGASLSELDEAIDNIKEENDIEEVTKSVEEGLDEIVDETVDKFVNPERWAQEVEE